MSAFEGLFDWRSYSEPLSTRLTDDSYWGGGIPSADGRLKPGDEGKALGIIPYFACVSFISDSAGQLPCITYRTESGGDRVRATDTPEYELLRWKPNPEMTAFTFYRVITSHAVTWGNGYAFIEQDPFSGRAKALWPLLPWRMRVDRVIGELVYRYTGFNGVTKTYRANQILHLRWFTLDGYMGVAPMCLVGRTLGLLDQEITYGAQFFKNGARPSLVIAIKKKITDAKRVLFEKSLQKSHGGAANAHKILALEEDAQFHALTIPPADADLIASMNFGALQVAAAHHCPPQVVNDWSRATHKNSEEMSLYIGKHTLGPLNTNWAQELSLKLHLRERGMFCEFLLDELLKADIRTRSEAFYKARIGGGLVGNQWRRMENWPAIDLPGMERPWIPTNMGLLPEAA